jgi:hypothetical protein
MIILMSADWKFTILIITWNTLNFTTLFWIIFHTGIKTKLIVGSYSTVLIRVWKMIQNGVVYINSHKQYYSVLTQTTKMVLINRFTWKIYWVKVELFCILNDVTSLLSKIQNDSNFYQIFINPEKKVLKKPSWKFVPERLINISSND